MEIGNAFIENFGSISESEFFRYCKKFVMCFESRMLEDESSERYGKLIDCENDAMKRIAELVSSSIECEFKLVERKNR